MNTEEKAKAYDEAIKKAEALYKAAEPMSGCNVLLETIFPELKESEDEEIRKHIISVLEDCWQTCKNIDYDSSRIQEDIAWLEKQGEQNDSNVKDYTSIDPHFFKTTDKIKPKFKSGDWVLVSTAEGDRVVQIASVEYSKDGHPSYFTIEGRWFGNGTKAHLLTDKDVETITLPESKVIVNQKPTWSEEDERILDALITSLNNEVFAGRLKTLKGIGVSSVIDWLKSLKDRCTWKPNEEQLKALHDLNLTGNISYVGQAQLLIELYNDLKKLTE